MKKRESKHPSRKTGTGPRPRRKVFAECPFCEADNQPSYKDWETLARFVSDRGKILGRSRTGVCAKHQRKLGREIKRARHLALLPFTIQVK